MTKSTRLMIIAMFATMNIAYGQLPEARKLFEAKKPDEAKKLLVTIKEQNTDYAAARYYLGRIAYGKKEFDDAVDYLEEAVDASAGVAEYHYWYGTAIAMVAQNSNVIKQGMLASKIKDQYEVTVKLDPRYMSAYWGLIEFYTAAPGFMGGSFEKAYETAATIGKLNEADGHRAMALVYTKEEKFVEAEKSYLEAYKANAAYYSYLLNFYSRRNEYSKTFTFLDQELKKQPYNFPMGYQYGRCSAMSGQNMDRGIEYLKKYLTYQPKENEPGHGGAYMRLGQLHEKQGKKSEAKKLFETALQLDPTLKEAKEGLERVSKSSL